MPELPQFAARSPDASHLRRRKYELVRRFGLPENLLGGSLRETHRRCGRGNCHCANGDGHPLWSITFSHRGKRRVERVPREWVGQLELAAEQTRLYVEAIREVMAINLELLAHTRAQLRDKKMRRRARRHGSGG